MTKFTLESPEEHFNKFMNGHKDTHGCNVTIHGDRYLETPAIHYDAYRKSLSAKNQLAFDEVSNLCSVQYRVSFNLLMDRHFRVKHGRFPNAEDT